MAERTIDRSPWIPEPRPNGRARLRLFCLPYAGGGAGMFRDWSANLPADIDVCPIQLPGRETRMLEPPYQRLDPMVDALAIAIRPYLEAPYAIFGHSMGALIAFSLTRQLGERYGSLPERLFVSGHRAPQLPDPDPPIHHLPEDQFIAEIRRLKGTPEEILQHAELMQLLLPRLRADLAVVETYTYVPGGPLTIPISVFGGEEDTEVTLAELEGWREQTSAQFRLCVFPGDHFFVHRSRAALWSEITERTSSR
jgi:medium-chain acyl-[acyl-carrier-protein] hydrolase